MLDVISLFREQGTVDELGLGVLRDAFADQLFPATSLVMTRARYFLFVPWIYRSLEGERVPSAEIARKGRRAEIKLIDPLLEAGDIEGVIGRVARDSLQRLPSNIYWNGLRALRICLFGGSRDMYHQSLDRYYRKQEVDRPYLSVYTGTLEDFRFKDNERIAFGQALRAALGEQARDWEAHDVDDANEPLAKYLPGHDDAERAKLLLKADTLFDFCTEHLPKVFQLADVIDAELQRLGR